VMLSSLGEGTPREDDYSPVSPCPVGGGVGTVEVPLQMKGTGLNLKSTYRSTVPYRQLLVTRSELLHGATLRRTVLG